MLKSGINIAMVANLLLTDTSFRTVTTADESAMNVGERRAERTVNLYLEWCNNVRSGNSTPSEYTVAIEETVLTS